MTSLQQFIDVQTQAIEESTALIAQLQQQLNELQTQLRVPVRESLTLCW